MASTGFPSTDQVFGKLWQCQPSDLYKPLNVVELTQYIESPHSDSNQRWLETLHYRQVNHTVSDLCISTWIQLCKLQ